MAPRRGKTTPTPPPAEGEHAGDWHGGDWHDGGPGNGPRGEGVEAEETPPLVGPVVRWREVTRVVRALGETVAPAQGLAGLERLVLGLADPLRRLDALAEDVDRALAGDDHAAEAVRSEIGSLAQRVDGARLAAALGEARHTHHRGCGCGCGPEPREIHYREGSDPGAVVVLRDASAHDDATGHEGAGHESAGVGAPSDDPSPRAVVDDGALTSLLIGAVAVVGPEGRQQALDVVTSLALAAGTLGGLALAHDEDGELGLVDHVESLAGNGALSWARVPTPAPMQTMSGAGPAMPGELPMPQLPGGLPGGVGRPGGIRFPDGIPGSPGKPPGPGDVEEWFKDRARDAVAELLKQFKGRKKWDPDIWDHSYPWWRDPLQYIDPRWWKLVQCLLAARKLLMVVDEPPPARPARVTWSDGITDVTESGPCAGATVTIRGKGFGPKQPAGVALLLPTIDGCRPVTPTSWSNTEITAVLPADVASGPVGFGDLAYITAYDAWADRHNQAAEGLKGLKCVWRVPNLVSRYSECPGVSEINRIRAGVAVITAFTANSQTLLALEPGVPLVLRWTVKNGDSITVERTSGSGPLFAGSSALVNPIFASHSFGVPPYSTLQVWTYRLTVTGACGGPVSRTVTVVATRRPALRIETIEVTQGIQTVPETVRLVESKPTAVRVTVRHGLNGWGANAVPGVRGRLRVRIPGVGTSPWFDAANGSGTPMAPNPGASITVKAAPNRDLIDDTLNFLVPPGWARGSQMRVEVEVRVAGFGAAGGFAGFSEQVTRNSAAYAFEARRTLQFRYIRMRWAGGAASTDAQCRSTLTAAVPLLPTPTAGIAPVPGVGVQTVNLATGSNGDDERRDLLDDWDDRHNCSTFEALFEWLGYDCPDDDGAVWVLIPGTWARGEAYAIPSNVCMTPPDDGPYAAHEIAHCLNQQHVRTRCGSPGIAVQGGDAASVWPNNGVLTDTPFDVVGHRTLAAAGGQVGDLMTYCPGYWPMPRRWQQLWDWIGT